ncbi:YjcZ family sporulation protein [Litchfieldia salsa]|uniref:Conserved hypothetical tiny transmembrane protein n=1 Tax=Litchfieldia salsa TaxID=930152 RepID=A0A1H0PVL4_9BACI|nr:YjcZ family sporulation protein [Litchfieldia salsa]SDP09182.1 conserved hypothetical tiny transmembrane protein [Litchfieldia salsa]
MGLWSGNCGYGTGYGTSNPYGNNSNSFTLLVVLFILLIIVGTNYPIAEQGD